MKKLLLVTTALVGVVAISAPASAAVKLDLGGFFRGYGVWADNDDAGGASLNSFEFRRDTEFHAGGETTLDNGLTVGAHGEMKVATAGSSTAITTDEIYAYGSGGWGRVNFGVEDGADYLLQVAAPSADSNIDGMRTTISSLNRQTLLSDNTAGTHVLDNSGLLNVGALPDYQHADQKSTDRISYLTPKYSGFQAGVSYAPKTGITSSMNGMASDVGTLGLHTGVAAGDTIATFDNIWEAAARWDGEFQGVGVSVGGGYSDSSLMLSPTTAEINALADNDYYINDGVTAYNGGLTLAWNGFSLGGNYLNASTSRITENAANTDVAGDITRETWNAGLGWDNGPYHLGASYVDTATVYDAIGAAGDTKNILKSESDTNKYAIGGGYTFGPGMTFRGAYAWGDVKHKGNTGLTDADSNGADAGETFTSADNNSYQQITVGTDIQF